MSETNPHEDSVSSPQEALALTRRMAHAGHRATRWVALWILLYGVGIGIVGVVIGATSGRGLVAILMAGWALFVGLTVAWSSRQRAAVKGMKQIMAIWAVCFAVSWGVTVFIGSWRFPHVMAWWIGCAVAIVVIHLILAGWVWRRSVRT